MTKLKLVFDVNVIISALLFPKSKPNLALEKAQDQGDILMSPQVWQELEEVIYRPKFERYIDLNDRQNFLSDFYQTITPIINFQNRERIEECRDIKDNKYLELAVNGMANYIITGDKDLLILHPFRNISIIKPQDFLQLN